MLLLFVVVVVVLFQSVISTANEADQSDQQPFIFCEITLFEYNTYVHNSKAIFTQIYFYQLVLLLMVYMKTLLDSDWLGEVQFRFNTSANYI